MATSIFEHLRILNLPPRATGADVQAAFRRLAKEYHPDLNRSRHARRRFIEIVRSYRALQNELGLFPDGNRRRLCPGCGQYDKLLEGLDGRYVCAPCLLGRSRRRLYLPAPIIEIVRHGLVFGSYGAAVWLALMFMCTAWTGFAVASLLFTILGFLALAVTCVVVRDFAHRRY